MPRFVDYKKGCTQLAAASDKVYQLLSHGRWFSWGTLAYSTTKTGHHDIAEILLKMALNIKNQINHYCRRDDLIRGRTSDYSRLELDQIIRIFA